MASKSGTGFKGFGQKPSLPPTRAPKSSDELCACESGKSYKDCCQPFHDGSSWPSTAEELMRSRYTAYAYRLPAWIMESTHRTNSDWRADTREWEKELLGFSDGFDFVGLEVRNVTSPAAAAGGGAGAEEECFVEFVARLRSRRQPKSAPKAVQDTLRKVKYWNADDAGVAEFRERSRFLRGAGEGRWMYAAGDVSFAPQVTLGSLGGGGPGAGGEAAGA